MVTESGIMDDFKEKLKVAECPSNWGLAEIKDRKSAAFIIDRLLDKEEESPGPWVHVCSNLTLAYLHSEVGDVTKAIDVLNVILTILNSSSDNIIVKYKPAIGSVYNASRACILSSSPSEVKMFADKIVPVRDLDICNQAAILAIKATVFSYFGVTGSTIAIKHAEEALKKNDKEAEWHFLMGKLLSRVRHFSQDFNISPAEISHLKTAFELAGTAPSAIFLANAYIQEVRNLRTESFISGNFSKSVTNKIKYLTAEAKRLIRLALDRNQNDCLNVIIRCAHAYTKLPPFGRDCKMAQQLLEESLKRSPLNPSANKLAGDLCLLDNEPMYQKALKHFEIAASRNVFSANFSAFEIKEKLNMNPNGESFYAKMLEQFSENNYQMLILIHATEYYLFIKRDLYSAVNYFKKAIELDPNFPALTVRWVKFLQKNVNYLELISNEVRHSIDNQMVNDADQLDILKSVLKKISEINPKLMEVPVVPNKVPMYLGSYGSNSKVASGKRKMKWREVARKK